MNKSKIINEIEKQLNYVDDPIVKIDLMNKLIIESRDNDSSSSFKLAEETLQLASDLKYKKGIAYSTLSLDYLKGFLFSLYLLN